MFTKHLQEELVGLAAAFAVWVRGKEKSRVTPKVLTEQLGGW